MAPATKRKPAPRVEAPKESIFTLKNAIRLAIDPAYIGYTCGLLLVFEVILNVFIIEKVKYTEIDWVAYMQEVKGVLNGTFDYTQLKGDTGPLVYPAGFVYVYSALYWVTGQGKNIYLGQYIFLGIFLVQIVLNYRIYLKTRKIPPYALVIATLTSYRIHSIYVLRLFNDPIAVLFFYVALNLFISNKWYLGSFFFSLAVSVKMNILLYAPCLLVAYLTNLGYVKTFLNLFICGILQVILGAPFLYYNFWGYLKGSFDLGRIFEHTWTVNYRFLPRDVFENKYLHLGLLILHILSLGLFLPQIIKYLKSYAKLNVITHDLKDQFTRERKQKAKENEKLSKEQQKFMENFEKQLKGKSCSHSEEEQKLERNLSKTSQLLVLPFYVTNLIGITFARSLHYQFYSWYFFSLLYLVFSTGYRKSVCFLLLGVIEYCWNVYPSTEISSILLHVCHFVILYGVYKNMRQ